MLTIVKAAKAMKNGLGQIRAIPAKKNIMEMKKGLRETEKTAVVISFPRFFESIPKRNDLLKLRRVNARKIREIAVSIVPETFKRIELKRF